MTNTTSEELSRRAADAEGGMPVSAGARVAHIRQAVESGRAFYVDLSGVPEEKRADVVAEIKDLVKRASAAVTKEGVHAVEGTSHRSG